MTAVLEGEAVMAFWWTRKNVMDPSTERIRDILSRLALFEGVATDDLAPLVEGMEWFSLPGGQTLMRRGDAGDSLYIITAGRFGLYHQDEAGQDVLIGEVGVGHTVGEMALLLGEPRVATIIALRDSELLNVSQAAFAALTSRHPVIMDNLARSLARRLRDTVVLPSDQRETGSSLIDERMNVPKSIALVPVTPGVPCRDLGEMLAATVRSMGLRTHVVTRDQDGLDTDSLHALETRCDHVFYLSDGEPDPWSRQCLRQADRVLLLARHNGLSPYTTPMEELLLEGPRRTAELAVLYPPGTERPTSSTPWVRQFNPSYHHNVRLGDQAAMARLARQMTGRAVGLVLAGGGARGFAHLGCMRALNEAGIPIDSLCGTSMGGIVAAGIATGWTLDEFTERMRRSFVETNPLSDVTIPRFAFVRGRKVSRLLEENFGSMRIEDLWLPFQCISANLTKGRQMIHKEGLLWRALRASIAIPGVLTPVVRRGHVLVDGAVMNNFPVSLLKEAGRGPVIGIDVEDHDAFSTSHPDNWPGSDWGVLGDTMWTGPSIISLLMRAGTVNSEMQSKRARARADLVLAPPLGSIGVPDWQSFDTAIEAGYRHTVEVLETQGQSLRTLMGQADVPAGGRI